MIDDDIKSCSDAEEISQGAQRSSCAREPTIGECRKQVPCDARASRAVVLPTENSLSSKSRPMEIVAVSATVWRF